MKYPCEMIKDVMPLYYDKACSEETKQIVETHLAECSSCQEVLKRLESNTYEVDLAKEREEVLRRHKKSVWERLAEVIAAIMLVPLVICLIVNLATAHTLDWFYIVLSGMAVVASLILVPLLAAEKKLLWTFLAFTGSILLLLFTCNQFSGGHWFGLAAIAVLFGLSVLFLPVIIYEIPLEGVAARNKGLLVMLTDTVLLYALILVCGAYVGLASYWRPALWITTTSAAFVWVLFGILRYMTLDKLIRAGICCILGGIFLSQMNTIVHWILEGVWKGWWENINLFVWNNSKTLNANINLLTAVLCLMAGTGLLIMGRKRRK